MPSLNWQCTAKASTCGGADASLLYQNLDGSLASAEYLRTSTRIRLAAILSADEALRDLGTYASVILHLFSAGGRNSSAVAVLLHIITSMEGLHTKVQGMISPPNLATTLLFDVSRRWSLYLNRCMDVSTSESLDSQGF